MAEEDILGAARLGLAAAEVSQKERAINRQKKL